MASTKSQKISWTLKASSKRSNSFDLAVIIDGVTSGGNYEKTIYHTKQTMEDKHPWIQIDLGSSKIVKAVHMHGYKLTLRAHYVFFPNFSRICHANTVEIRRKQYFYRISVTNLGGIRKVRSLGQES